MHSIHFIYQSINHNQSPSMFTWIARCMCILSVVFLVYTLIDVRYMTHDTLHGDKLLPACSRSCFNLALVSRLIHCNLCWYMSRNESKGKGMHILYIDGPINYTSLYIVSINLSIYAHALSCMIKTLYHHTYSAYKLNFF